MAKLRIRQDAVGTPQMPQTQASAASFGGQEGQALSQFGGALAQYGAAVGEEDKRVARLNNAKRLTSAALHWAERRQELDNAQDASVDPTGYAKSIADEFDQWSNQQLEGLSGYERDHLEANLLEMRGKIVTDAAKTQVRNIANAEKNFFVNSRSEFSNKIARFDGAREELYNLLATGTDALGAIADELPLSDPDRAQIKQENQTILSKALFQNLLSDGAAGAEEALSLIDTGAFDDVDPAVVERAKSEADSIIKADKRRRKQEVADDIKTRIDAASNGSPEFATEKLDGEYSRDNLVKVFGEKDGEEAYQALKSSARVGTYYRDLSGMSPSNWQDEISRAKARVESAKTASGKVEARGELSAMTTALGRVQKAFANDPVSFLSKQPYAESLRKEVEEGKQRGLSDATAMAPMVSWMVAEQRNAGVPEASIKVLSEQQADQIDSIISTGSPEEALSAIEMLNGYGEYAGNAWSQLTDNDDSMYQYLLLSETKSGPIMASGIRAIRNMKENRKAAIDMGLLDGETAYVETQAYEALRDQLEPLKQSLLNDVRPWQQARELAIAMAYDAVNTGSDVDFITAVEDAGERIINETYDFPGYGGSTLRVPKGRYDTDAIEAGMRMVLEKGAPTPNGVNISQDQWNDTLTLAMSPDGGLVEMYSTQTNPVTGGAVSVYDAQLGTWTIEELEAMGSQAIVDERAQKIQAGMPLDMGI